MTCGDECKCCRTSQHNWDMWSQKYAEAHGRACFYEYEYKALCLRIEQLLPDALSTMEDIQRQALKHNDINEDTIAIRGVIQEALEEE